MSNLARTLYALAAVVIATPAAPAHAAEQTLRGELVVAVAEDQHGKTTTSAAVRTTTGFVPVEGAGVEDMTPGTEVIVRATPGSDGTYHVRTVQTLSAPSTSRATTVDPGEHEIVVAVVQPKGVGRDKQMTKSAVIGMMHRAAAFWADQGVGVPFTTITWGGEFASPHSCRDYWGLWGHAAHQVRFTEAPGKHLVLVLPRAAYRDGNCPYGLGTVGNDVTSGGWAYVADLSTSATAHELGHNLSLHHAGAFSDGVGESLDGDGVIEYGDLFDVMGVSYSDAPGVDVGNVNARAQQRLGLLPPAEQVRVTSTTTITLQALDRSTGTAHPRLAQVTDPTTGVTYHLEYRSKVGRDLKGWAWAEPGVVVRVDHPLAPKRTVVVDTFSESYLTQDAALSQGETWTSKGGGVHVTVVGTTKSSARVHVGVGTTATRPKVTLAKPATTPVYRTKAKQTLVARVSHDAPGKVRFQAVHANGKVTSVGTAKIVDGTAALDWTPKVTSSPVKAVRATYLPGTAIFGKTATERTVKVAPTPTRLKTKVTSGKLNATVTALGKPATGTVKVAATDARTGKTRRLKATLDKNGAVKIDLRRALGKGVYHLKVTYSGDKATRGFTTYAGASSAAVVRTGGAKVTPKVKVTTSKRDPATVTVKVTTKGGAAEGKVVLRSKGTKVTARLVEGRATVKLPGSPARTWSVTYTGSGPLGKAAMTFRRARA